MYTSGVATIEATEAVASVKVKALPELGTKIPAQKITKQNLVI